MLYTIKANIKNIKYAEVNMKITYIYMKQSNYQQRISKKYL